MILRLSAIVGLVLLNGFFVAAEFALVRSRRARLEAMTRSGDRLARIALKASSNISGILSASQLGVTLASLGLGWIAATTLSGMFTRWFAGLPFVVELPLALTLGGLVAYLSASYLHIVFGELAPKAAALNHPERFARLLVPPLLAFAWIMTPFMWVLNRSTAALLRLLGQKSDRIDETVHSPEELRLLVEQAQESGSLEHGDAEMLDAVFEFSEKSAREVMTPRMEIIALPVGSSLREVLRIVEESGVSRYPVYDDTIDDIVGIVLAKDLLRFLAPSVSDPAAIAADSAAGKAFSLTSLLRPVHVIPGSREVEDVLADFKRLKVHMAVVLDEYGGTAGIVTMEDLLEEIVGEILDEYDTPEDEGELVQTRSGETIVPGGTNIRELNDRFGLNVPEADATTIGGYVFGILGRLPMAGDRVIAGGAIFTVREIEGRRIESLAVDLHSLGDRREEEREPQSAGRAE